MQRALHYALAWGLCVLLAGGWETLCSHTNYDLRRSTGGCTRLKGDDGCALISSWCAEPALVRRLSPRALSDAAGYGGPLLMWVPLLLLGGGDVLRPTVAWYAALIGVVRHARLVMPSNWDPSGHVFVYGAQLVPYWWVTLGLAQPRGAALNALRVWAAVWASVLVMLSATTAAFFHTVGESVAGWLLVLALHHLLARLDSTPADQSAALRLAVLVAAAPLWVVATVAGWVGGAAAAMSAGELAYDVVLWVWLLRSLGVTEPTEKSWLRHVPDSSPPDSPPDGGVGRGLHLRSVCKLSALT